jgi:hypothetical protein
MELSTQLIRKLEGVDPNTRDLLLTFMDEVEEKTRIISVGRNDFNELKGVVKRIAEAQERTEQRIGSLTIAIENLSAAQEKTERRVEALTFAQEKTEGRLEALTFAQEKTEGRLEALTTAQENLTIAQERLAEAQERTERSLRDLIKDHKDVKKQLGGLSMDVGYGIEDKMIPHLPAFGKKVFGVDLTMVDRRNVIYADGKYDEVNLYCEGSRDGEDVFVIGEAKAQPGKKDFDDFSKKLNRLKGVLKGDIEAFIVGYQYSPPVESYADTRYPQIRRYRTFDITAFPPAPHKEL